MARIPAVTRGQGGADEVVEVEGGQDEHAWTVEAVGEDAAGGSETVELRCLRMPEEATSERVRGALVGACPVSTR
ncbi:hypothetical protein [Streptomyces sp. NPDC048392]|uniref:hypothetical protein n=1 Tax=Streptomyces sp. NPDC048392 TaxID=3365543 RepID=UPI0037223117